MPLSPRTLRPANNVFTPKSISGLALWLDASSADTLYTTDAGPVTAVSSPTEISGCALWLDGADSSAASMTLNGSLVETWKDKSGNGRDFTATSTARPTLTPSAINSRSAVTFAGSLTTMTGNTAAQDVIRNLAGYTIFTAIRTASVAGGERFAFGVGSTILFRTGQQDSRPFIGGRRLYADTLESVTDGSGTLTTGTAFIQTAVVNHSSQSLTGIRNGAAFATDATYMGAGTVQNNEAATSVGSQGGGTYGFWNGDIAEIVVFNTALSTADRARVEAYLAAKWAISGVHAPATASSDPVGYWADKSGNARHATQGTAGSRPTISVPSGGTEMVNGRRALLAFSSNAGGVGLGNIGSAFPNSSGTAFFAYKVNDGGTGIDNSYGIAMSRLNNSSTQSSGSNEGFWRTSRLAGTNPAPLPTSGYGAAIYTINSAASGYTLRYNSAPFYTTATQDWNAGNSYYLWSDPASNMTRLGGWIGEAILYNRSLSASETRRVEQYLSSRWGIAIAPQVSNADAQDWVNRVYANGGTVSASTAAAVNTLCDSLDAASLRDRFYRLNLFCGSNLNAALVPLYLTPDKTVTNLFQFGADPTNAAWLAGGNGAITRAATAEVGPLGYGYATKLTTPSAPFDVRQMYQQMPLDGRQATVSAWMKTSTGTRQIQWLAGNVYSDTVTVTTTWQRFTKTFTLPTSTDARTGFSTVSELSDAAGFIYVWGMQCEYGATATSYNQPRYGNATDTNVGPFVSGDFADSTGLAAGSGKYLRTGLTQANVGTACHLAFYDCAKATNAYANRIGSRGASDTHEHAITNLDVATTMDYGSSAVAGNGRARATGYTQAGAFWLGVNPSATSAILYKNGVSAATSTPSARTAQNLEYWAFALNNNGTLDSAQTTGRSGGYSIGAAMDATQAAAYYTAMQAFQTALTRNV